jgi:hypothetical protein
MGALLAGCAEETPPPEVPTGPSLEAPTPVATEEQLDRAIAEIHDAVTKADKKQDADLLAPRIVGSIVNYRKSSYKIIKKVEDHAKSLTRPGSEAVVTVTSTDGEYPRHALALVEGESEDDDPFFMLLQQEDARSPYTTWGWAQRMAGVEMPKVAASEVGSEPVADDADDLVMTPKKAFALFAKVLSDGNSADKDDKLASNPFQTAMHANIKDEREQLNEGVDQDEVGTVKETYKIGHATISGMRTDDGGAIVMGSMNSSRVIEIADGAKVSYAEDNLYTEIIGEKTFTSEYKRDFGNIFALYIPTKDDGGKVQPIAWYRSERGASGE